MPAPTKDLHHITLQFPLIFYAPLNFLLFRHNKKATNNAVTFNITLTRHKPFHRFHLTILTELPVCGKHGKIQIAKNSFCTILTTEANSLVRENLNRMPDILTRYD